MNYVAHVCKNSKLRPAYKNYCNNMWVDKDKYNAQSNPPSWRYCPDCVQKGFSNVKEKIIPEWKKESARKAGKERLLKINSALVGMG